MMITGALLAAGIIMTYWEIKKTQTLLDTMLVSIRELRALTYPNKNIRNQQSNNNQMAPLNKESHPRVVINKQVRQNNIKQIKEQMSRYEDEINNIDSMLESDNEDDIESDNEDVNLDELRKLAENYN